MSRTSRLPTDAEVWQRRTAGVAGIAAEAGLSATYVRTALGRRGWHWVRGMGDRLRLAPCAGRCGQPLPVEGLDDARLCAECRTVRQQTEAAAEPVPEDTRRLLRVERAAFLRRHPEWADRSGGAP